jgi:hypothetical protein
VKWSVIGGFWRGTWAARSEPTMQAAALRQMIETMLPRDVIEEAVCRLGVQHRKRLMDPVALVYSLVLMGGTWEAGRIAAVMRDYFERGAPAVARGSYYKWFDEQLLALMVEIARGVRAQVEAMPKHLPGILADRVDWRAVDSTVVKLPRELAAVFPGTGDYASLKVHKEYSLGTENVVGYHITPGRVHDGPELVIDEKRRGTGLVVDLGYASMDLLRKCDAHDVHVVVRLKSGWKVYVDELADTGTWRGAAHVPDSAESPIDLVAREKPLDIDVTVGPDDDPVSVRLVGLPFENEYVYFLSNLARATHSAEEVGMIYRLRWGIEVDNKLSKSACQLDEITAERPVSALILVHASMIASMIANAIVHLDNIEQGAVGAKTVRPKRPPLHPISVWKIVVAHAEALASVLAAGHDPEGRWLRLANHLTRGAGDPNWRNRASAMDRVKGRTPAGRAWRKNAPDPATHAKAIT